MLFLEDNAFLASVCIFDSTIGIFPFYTTISVKLLSFCRNLCTKLRNQVLEDLKEFVNLITSSSSVVYRHCNTRKVSCARKWDRYDGIQKTLGPKFQQDDITARYSMNRRGFFTSPSTLANRTAPTAADFPHYEEKEFFKFKVLHRSSRSSARVGIIETPHGSIDTPGFVAVATNGALKAVDWNTADMAGLQLAFANTYHLMLHPGEGVIADAGGLHNFIGRKERPLITDSGGFQVFSLAYGTVHQELHSIKRAGSSNGVGKGSNLRSGNLVQKIDESGVKFRSYRDGKLLHLSPESSIEAQKKIGADIILPLDQLTPFHVDGQSLAQATNRSHRWEARSLKTHIENPKQQAIYGIVHGGPDLLLRQHSATYISSLPFDGIAIGGTMGRNHSEMINIFRSTIKHLQRDLRPIHVLGIADPISAPHLVSLGADTMDSCYATRVGRHGSLLTKNGIMRVAASINKTNYNVPAIESCDCHTCQNYSLAFLHHLVKSHEPLASTLCSLHNIHFMCKLFEEIRSKIKKNEL